MEFFHPNSSNFIQPNNLEKTQDRQRHEGVTEPHFVSLLSWVGPLQNIPCIPTVVITNGRPHENSANNKKKGKSSSEGYLDHRKGIAKSYNAVVVIKVCEKTKNFDEEMRRVSKHQGCTLLAFERYMTHHTSKVPKLRSKIERRNERFLEVPPTISNQGINWVWVKLFAKLAFD